MITLSTGCKAYIDSYSGLIACRVLSVRDGLAIVLVTARKPRGGYWRGERVERTTGQIVPREAIRRTRYGNMIRRYDVIAD